MADQHEIRAFKLRIDEAQLLSDYRYLYPSEKQVVLREVNARVQDRKPSGSGPIANRQPRRGTGGNP